MNVSTEITWQTEERLRRLMGLVQPHVYEGHWHFHEFPASHFPFAIRADALAIVRGESGWSQLVPLREGGHAHETFTVWSLHFPPDRDNSGFVGWLATILKQRLGTGIAVVCGYDASRGGIFDLLVVPQLDGRPRTG